MPLIKSILIFVTVSVLLPSMVACVYDRGYSVPPSSVELDVYSKPWDYYYYPDIQVYFNYTSGLYFYLSNGNWVRTRLLPPRFHPDPNNRVHLHIETDKPYLFHDRHVEKYRPDHRHSPNSNQDRNEYDRRHDTSALWDYYYYPDIQVYYNDTSGLYFYLSNGNWVRTKLLPPRFRPDPGNRIQLHIETDKPYLFHDRHVEKYRPDHRHTPNWQQDREEYDDDYDLNRGNSTPWDYYYYPEFQVYFNFTSGLYFYLSNGNWVRTRLLPPRFRPDPRNRVHLHLETDKPYLFHDRHVKKYRPDYRRSPIPQQDRKEHDDNHGSQRHQPRVEERRNVVPPSKYIDTSPRHQPERDEVRRIPPRQQDRKEYDRNHDENRDRHQQPRVEEHRNVLPPSKYTNTSPRQQPERNEVRHIPSRQQDRKKYDRDRDENRDRRQQPRVEERKNVVAPSKYLKPKPKVNTERKEVNEAPSQQNHRQERSKYRDDKHDNRRNNNSSQRREYPRQVTPGTVSGKKVDSKGKEAKGTSKEKYKKSKTQEQDDKANQGNSDEQSSQKNRRDNDRDRDAKY